MDTQPQFTVLLKNADKLERVVINAKNEKRALKLGEKREAEILDVAVKPQPQLHNVVDRHAFLPHKILERGHLYSSHPIKVLPASGQTFMYRATADQLAMQQTLYRVRSRERQIQQQRAAEQTPQ